MGTFDNLGSILSDVMNNGGTQQVNPLLQIARKILTEQGVNGQSGLADIIAKFQQGGLGDIAKSWIGTGENQSVSAAQISSILSNGKLSEIASKLGMLREDVAGGLSKILPVLVNHAAPDGHVPESNDFISNALAMFLKK